MRPERVAELVGAHVLAAVRRQYLEQLHRPPWPLAGKLDRLAGAFDQRTAEQVYAEAPGPLRHAQWRRARCEALRAHQAFRQLALDAMAQCQRAKLGGRFPPPPGQVGEALFARQAEGACERRYGGPLVARKARGIGSGEVDGEKRERDAEPLGGGTCGTHLRLGIARIAGLGEQFRPRGARQALEQWRAGLGGQRARRLCLAMRERCIAFEPGEPGFEEADDGAIAAAQRAPRLEPLQLAARRVALPSTEVCGNRQR